MKQDTLQKAPIVEAVIDFVVSFGQTIEMSSFDGFSSTVKTDYPKIERMILFTHEAAIGSGSQHTKHTEQCYGQRYSNHDGTQIIQARLDGFSLSRLEPYKTWNTFRDEAARLWRLFLETVQPVEIRRVATRFINRIQPGVPSIDLLQRLKTRPFSAPDLCSEPIWFFSRFELTNLGENIRALVTQQLEPADDQGNALLVFDIDVFSERTYAAFDETVWEKLEELRSVKNRIFFSSFSEQAKEWFT